MTITLTRHSTSENGTFGKLHIPLFMDFYTFEDQYIKLKPDCSNKINKETAIPEGLYRIIITQSQRFKKLLPLLLKVRCFEGIRIHSGNTKKDTSGCILIGMNHNSFGVSGSKIAVDLLMGWLQRALLISQVRIEIINKF